MKFKKLSEYDDEIKKIDSVIDSLEKYIEEHPEEIGGRTNCEGLKYIRDELKKERDNLEFSKATQGAFDWCDISKNSIEVDEDKKQKIINLLNELGIKEFSCLTKGEIHFLNLTDSQVKKLLEAQSNEYKNDFYLLGIRKHPNTPMHHYLQLKNGGKDTSDRYTVINNEEPYGQSVAVNGIPCTARCSVATLNRLTQENHRMSIMIQEFNKLLNNLFKESNRNWAKASKSKKEIDIACAYAQLKLIKEIIDKMEEI